jgi:hypothetical protein
MQQINIEMMEVQVPLAAVDRLYAELNSMIGTGTITSTNIITILFSLMQTIEQYTNVNGVQKKAVIIRVLDRFIKDKLGNTQEARDVSLIVKTALPSVIDTFVAIDTQKLKIKSKQCFKKIFACCG